MVTLLLVETVVRAYAHKAQRGRQGTCVFCCSVALLLVTMVMRAFLCKLQHGRWGMPIGSCVVGYNGAESLPVQGSVWQVKCAHVMLCRRAVVDGSSGDSFPVQGSMW